MLDVNSGDPQADAHLLRLPGSDPILIDAGDPQKNLVQLLKKEKVTALSQVLISHAHKDHYEGLTAIVDSGISVGGVYFNLPPQAVCDKERPWGCDYGHVQALLKFLQLKKIPVVAVKEGDVIVSGDGFSLAVAFLLDPKTTPLAHFDINDLSQILRLNVGKSTVLFTGDLNRAYGDFLVERGVNLKADILKVPHHGTDSVVSNEFFDRVGAKLALVPGPKKLWESERSERIRNYFLKHKVEIHIGGIEGRVSVKFGNKGFNVTSERTAKKKSR